MRAIMTLLLTTALLTTAVPVLADGHGEDDRHCKDRDGLGIDGTPIDGERDTCTDIQGGDMWCMPEGGKANDYSVVVGWADHGTFTLQAVGAVDKDARHECFFEVRVDESQIRFNEGYSPGILAPYGGASHAGDAPCVAYPGMSCTAEASFHWWRQVHGVTFDVPYELYVNGILVDQGEVHYYDPPAMELVTGGPIVFD